MKKQEPLQLQRISVFMPQRLRDDEVERLFIMRQDVFHTLLDSIKTEKTTSIPQHHLIIGQRGMGKTTLLKRLDVELRNSSLSKKFIPFTFPEEQYNIDRLSKFWLNSLDALADTLQTEGDEKMAFQLDEQIATLSVIRNEQELSQKAYELLRDSAKTLGRRPVFLLDNLNLIFDRLGEVEQSKLRKLITEPGAPIFIGASPEAFDEDLQYDAPFYDAFAVHFLYKLDFRQTLTMLRHLAEITNQTTLLSQLTADNMPRLETLHQLTGGNVRTVVILFSLVAQGFSADVFQDLEALIDQMTPLYKSRFEELAPQAQVVVDAVALNWDPCKLETLRERTSLENNQLSVQLDRLAKAGWISKLGKRKAAYYEISERFFNVWYLIRRATRRQRRDLLWLTRFLQAWFTRTELVQQMKAFMRDVHEKENEYELAYGLALARALPELKTAQSLKESIYYRILDLAEGDIKKIEDYLGVDIEEVEREILNTYKKRKSFHIAHEARKYEILEEDWQKAQAFYEQALELNKANDYAWRSYGSILEKRIKDLNKAEEAYRNATIYNPNEPQNWVDLGRVLENKGQKKEAEDSFKKAIEVRESAWSWEKLGSFYKRVTRYEEARIAYDKALKLYRNDQTIVKLAELLAYNLLRESEAEILFKEAISMVSKNHWDYLPRVHYAWFLQTKGRMTEAEDLLKPLSKTKAKSPNPNIFFVYADFLIKDNRLDEAEQLMLKATQTETGQKQSWCWEELGKVYVLRHKFLEAIQAYEQALSLDPNDLDIKSKAMVLIRDFTNDLQAAKELFEQLKDEYKHNYLRFIGEAAFHIYEKDWKSSKMKWQESLQAASENLPNNAEGDFYSSAAVTVRLGYGEQLQAVFRETGHDRIFRPFYEAIKALTLNSEEYLKTEVAAEVRDVALQIFKFMQDYNAPVSTEGANG